MDKPISEEDEKDWSITREEDYYDMYRTALFGVASKKAGWDSLRKYEILANGCVPFLVDIDEVPPGSIATFPFELVRKAMNLRGMPSVDAVKKAEREHKLRALGVSNDFDFKGYYEIRRKLLEHTRQHMTTTALASYVLDVMKNN